MHCVAGVMLRRFGLSPMTVGPTTCVRGITRLTGCLMARWLWRHERAHVHEGRPGRVTRHGCKPTGTVRRAYLLARGTSPR